MLRRVRKYLWPRQLQSNGISGRKLSQIARQMLVAIGNALAWQRQPLHTRRHLEVPPQPVVKTKLARFVQSGNPVSAVREQHHISVQLVADTP